MSLGAHIFCIQYVPSLSTMEMVDLILSDGSVLLILNVSDDGIDMVIFSVPFSVGGTGGAEVGWARELGEFPFISPLKNSSLLVCS